MFAKAEIIAVENIPLKSSFSGILRKENIRSFDLENLDLFKCFKPNDIIKARVLQ